MEANQPIVADVWRHAPDEFRRVAPSCRSKVVQRALVTLDREGRRASSV